MTNNPVGVPVTPENKNPFIVRVEAWWRDHQNNLEPTSKIMEFKGVDKADVYSYIKYYALEFGLVDLQHRGEGYEGDELAAPDMTDPLVQEQIEFEELPNEESEKPTTQKTVSARTNKKKSRKKR